LPVAQFQSRGGRAANVRSRAISESLQLAPLGLAYN